MPCVSDRIENASAPVAVFEGADDERVPLSQRLSTTLDKTDQAGISLTVYDEALRSRHSGIWLSENALRYRADHPDGSPVDTTKSNQLDPSFINTVLSFYHSAL